MLGLIWVALNIKLLIEICIIIWHLSLRLVSQVQRLHVGSSAASLLLPAPPRGSGGPRTQSRPPSLLRPQLQPLLPGRLSQESAGFPRRRPGGAEDVRPAPAEASCSHENKESVSRFTHKDVCREVLKTGFSLLPEKNGRSVCCSRNTGLCPI